jgi:general secretion pathway protein G
MDTRKSGHSGFTLLELLVVFTLLALLLTIAVPRYMQTAENSRDKAREQNIATLRDALDKFKADKGRFPATLDELVSTKYLRKIPVDPVSGSTQWVVVQDATGAESGVSDVEPPNTSEEDAPKSNDGSATPVDGAKAPLPLPASPAATATGTSGAAGLAGTPLRPPGISP